METARRLRVLQIGAGGFGRQHLEAWQALGAAGSLWLAEADAERRDIAQRLAGIEADRVGEHASAFFDRVDVVDIVTPTDGHYPLAMAAMEAGLDVFIEKPMTMTAGEAQRLSSRAHALGRIVQVGYCFRWHPASARAKAIVDSGALGTLRYLSGHFMGFKRARRDVGVTQSDAVHFIDLINWLTGLWPQRLFAVTRDHFGRGMDDLSVVLLEYPAGIVAHVESGYIQPGRWPDRVVAGAMTTKSLTVCGSAATLDIDYEDGRLDVHQVRHELRSGVWTAVHDGTETIATGAVTPDQMVASELASFLDAVRDRREPDAGVDAAGVVMARIVEAVAESAERRAPVTLADD